MSLVLERVEEFSLMTIDRPDALNALNLAIIDEFRERLEEVRASGSRTLLITGRGDKAFSAGADVTELVGKSLRTHKLELLKGQSAFNELAQLPIPSVAIINGYALGGGLELAMACTFRLATPNARMGLPEVKIGNVPGYGGTQRLPRLIGEARATELVLTGRMVSAEEAERIGLVNRVIEGDALQEAIAFAREFSGNSLPVMAYGREAVAAAWSTALTDGMRIESDLASLAYGTEDGTEGLAAFLEKRKAEFKDA